MRNVNEVLESYYDYINKVPDGIRYIINGLRNKGEADILTAIGQFSEGLIWIMDASKVLSEHGENTEFNIDGISQYLDEITQGLEKQDFYLVADIFEYEILEFFINLSGSN